MIVHCSHHHWLWCCLSCSCQTQGPLFQSQHRPVQAWWAGTARISVSCAHARLLLTSTDPQTMSPDPWDQEHGWEQTKKQTCQQLLTAADHDGLQGPPYCSWHGVTCCTAQQVASGRCWLVNSVSGVNQAMNNVNVSLENPVLFKALKTLHDCGMSMLNFESNNIGGRMTEEWGHLQHMQYINLGKWLKRALSGFLSHFPAYLRQAEQQQR